MNYALYRDRALTADGKKTQKGDPMNILFFLTPKDELAYIFDDYSLRQTVEKMEHHRYTSIPVLSREGKYVGAITEGDLLWFLKNEHELTLKDAEQCPISEVHRHADYRPVKVSTNIDDLVAHAMEQNFVPVVDDRDIFIGIITRKNMIKYLYNKANDIVPQDAASIVEATANL